LLKQSERLTGPCFQDFAKDRNRPGKGNKMPCKHEDKEWKLRPAGSRSDSRAGWLFRGRRNRGQKTELSAEDGEIEEDKIRKEECR